MPTATLELISDMAIGASLSIPYSTIIATAANLAIGLNPVLILSGAIIGAIAGSLIRTHNRRQLIPLRA